MTLQIVVYLQLFKYLTIINNIYYNCLLFKYIFYERIHTHVSGIKESHYFHCKEVLIAEIYELNPTPEQKLALIDLMQKQSGDYIWLDAGVIRAKGYDMSQKGEVARVSETASWIL